MLTTNLSESKSNLPAAQKVSLPASRIPSAREKFRTMLFAFGSQLRTISAQIGNQLFWTGEAPNGLEISLVKNGGKLTTESSLYAEHQMLELINKLGDYALFLSSLSGGERLHHFNACCGLYKPRGKKADGLAPQAPSARDELTSTVMHSPRPEDSLQPGQKKKRRHRK
ncbi:MAG: hypothetical protein U1E78_10950 [Gammaproteobacteria bacterium]